MLSTPTSINSSKCRRTRVRVCPVKQRRVRCHTESRPPPPLLTPSMAMSYPPSRHTAEVMVLPLPIHMHRERQVLRRRKQVQLLLQQQARSCTCRHTSCASTRPGHNLRHLRVQQRLATRNRHHRRAALIHRAEAHPRAKAQPSGCAPDTESSRIPHTPDCSETAAPASTPADTASAHCSFCFITYEATVQGLGNRNGHVYYSTNFTAPFVVLLALNHRENP